MIELFEVCAQKSKDFVYEKSMSGLELIYKLIDKVNEVIEIVNTFQDQIDGFEKSDNITNSRRLSQSGNFTGTWFNQTHTQLNALVDSNEDQIKYIADQFNDGQTGFVINGGFFEETGIEDNYNGGVF